MLSPNAPDDVAGGVHAFWSRGYPGSVPQPSLVLHPAGVATPAASFIFTPIPTFTETAVENTMMPRRAVAAQLSKAATTSRSMNLRRLPMGITH